MAIAVQSLFSPSHLAVVDQTRPTESDSIILQDSNHLSYQPWGQLEVTRVPLEEREVLLADGPERLKQARWRFESTTPGQVLEFFLHAGLNDGQAQELLNTNHWEIDGNGCSVTPTDALLLSLSPNSRGRIYSELARFPANYAQCFPFRFALTGFEDRFVGSGLSRDRINLVHGLVYTNRNLISFSDLALLQKTFSTNEFHALVKTLYSLPAVMVRAVITPDSDLAALVQYWGTAGREKRIRPLVESLARSPGGGAVNISYFMPPFARLGLYTYPDPKADEAEAKQDCFYTALNFFNENPDQSFAQAENTRRALVSDYTMISGPPTFGDLMVLANSRGDALHVAVFIAADVVFTKNGINYLQPWTLMRIPDMMAYFPSEEPLRLVIMRRKDRSATVPNAAERAPGPKQG